MCAVLADGYIRGDGGEKSADRKRNKSVKGDECRHTLLIDICTFFEGLIFHVTANMPSIIFTLTARM